MILAFRATVKPTILFLLNLRGSPHPRRGMDGFIPRASPRATPLKSFFCFVLFFFFFFFFSETGFLCIAPGCPGSHSVDQVGLELRNLPASASQVLGLKASTPGSLKSFK